MGLESDTLSRLEFATKLGELFVADLVCLEEGSLILREELVVRLEAWICHENPVGGESDALRVKFWHVCEVGVVELGPLLCPRATSSRLGVGHEWASALGVSGRVAGAFLDSARSIGEGTAQGVSATKSHNVLVIHAILVEDIAKVLCRILIEANTWETKRRWLQIGWDTVHTAILHGNLGTSGYFDAGGGGQLNQICPRHIWHLLLDGLQVDGQGLLQSCIRTCIYLVVSTDRANGTAGIWPWLVGICHVVSARVVPSKTNEDRSAGDLFHKFLNESLGLEEVLLLLAASKNAAEAVEAGHGEE
mmetsp:Transcript_55747/g.99261  ORF Transcript_55747/g.99261 Transcript_55747/m.99261 type:complete len:305 (+) Transcript_55747:242-1156(+)